MRWDLRVQLGGVVVAPNERHARSQRVFSAEICVNVDHERPTGDPRYIPSKPVTAFEGILMIANMRVDSNLN
jgi:hypothetical protein